MTDYAIHETRGGRRGDRPSFSVTVTGREGSYLVSEIRDPADADRIADILPAPSAASNGARLLAVTDLDFVGDERIYTHHFLLENPDDVGGLEYDRLYDAAGISSGEPVETHARRPDLAIVAMNETHGWNYAIVAALGRIKGIYRINRNDDTYAQVWMEFLSNQCERSFADLDEVQIDDELSKLGYDTFTDFESNNSGDQGREIGTCEVSKLETLEVLFPSAEWIAEYMLEPSEGRRLELEREYYWEVKANGLPGIRFNDARSDAEIIEGGKLIVAQSETPSP